MGRKHRLGSRWAWILTILVALGHTAVGTVLASPPGEVGPGLEFAADKQTLSWSPVSGADLYNVYRGSIPMGWDLSCLAFHLPGTSVTDPESPGSLFLYLVAARNADGDGTLGNRSDGSPRWPALVCVDDDGDAVRDDLDNCPGLANPAQLDQDLDGRGDGCDPQTYDFEGDVVGSRPAETSQDGISNRTFLVRDDGGDQAVSYDGGAEGAYDRFDRLSAGQPFQDQDIHVDTTSVFGETLALELWSDGTLGEDAGAGLRFTVAADGSVRVSRRLAGSLTALGPWTSVAGADRLRLRVRKGQGTISRVFVDRWDGAAWIQANIFATLDDHLVFGRQLAIVNQDGGRRSLRRITARPIAPDDALVVARSFDGLTDGKLFQRGPDGDAPIPVPFSYRANWQMRLELRLVDQGSGQPLPGFDYTDWTFTMPAAPDGAAGFKVLTDVPQGGNYELQARLVDPGTSNVMGQQVVTDLAVGDVFLAAGQSNMSGYSGGLEPAEPPVPEVRLFGNDYVWKQAQEPMDSGIDQVDQVSAEAPSHSPMLRFGKELASALGVPVAIVPAPLAGTRILADWQRNDADPTDRGTLYGSSIHRVLAQGYAHPIRGVIWYQGESDLALGTEVYQNALEQLVSDYRADLGNPSLFFGNVQLATNQNSDPVTWLAIQEAQRRQAAADPLTALVSVVDQPRASQVHLSVEGYKETGARLARAVLAGAYGLPLSAGPELLSVTLAAGGSRIDLTYSKSVSGGGATELFLVEDDGAPIPLSSVVAAGDTVSLLLALPVQGQATVSYGFGHDPALPWTTATDGSGAALCFDALPVER